MFKKNIFSTNQFVPSLKQQFNKDFFKNYKLEKWLNDLKKKIGNGENLFIFLSSSGTGRDRVIENCRLMIKNSERIKKITTRKPREKNEIKKMFFVSKQEFLKKFKERKIIFAGRYLVNKQFYGVNKKEIWKLKSKNKI
jgi:guanylate kinase